MLTQATYIEYLLSTPRNYTCTHLADHLPSVSHDQVNRFLRNSSFSVNQLRALVLPLLNDSPGAFLFVDDSVQDKRYSRFIEVAKRQYSGAAHGLVTGICFGQPRAQQRRARRFFAPGLPHLRPRTGPANQKRAFPGHVRPRRGGG